MDAHLGVLVQVCFDEMATAFEHENLGLTPELGKAVAELGWEYVLHEGVVYELAIVQLSSACNLLSTLQVSSSSVQSRLDCSWVLQAPRKGDA